jgi:hypothetical protein
MRNPEHGLDCRPQSLILLAGEVEIGQSSSGCGTVDTTDGFG